MPDRFDDAGTAYAISLAISAPVIERLQRYRIEQWRRIARDSWWRAHPRNVAMTTGIAILWINAGLIAMIGAALISR